MLYTVLSGLPDHLLLVVSFQAQVMPADIRNWFGGGSGKSTAKAKAPAKKTTPKKETAKKVLDERLTEQEHQNELQAEPPSDKVVAPPTVDRWLSTSINLLNAGAASKKHKTEEARSDKVPVLR